MKIFINKHYKGRLQKAFLKTGVQLTQRLRPASPGTEAVPPGKTLGVVCSFQQYRSLKPILEKKYPYERLLLLELKQVADEKMLLEHFPQIIYDEKPDDLAWYTANVSFATCIGCMEKLPGQMRHYFIDPGMETFIG